MKVTRSTIGLSLAGLLLVGGTGAVMAAGTPAAGGTEIVVPAEESASPDGTAGATRPKDTILTDVLDDLVAKGTIDDGQKTAIIDALDAERTARREARQAEREQLRGFLEDGQITQEELDQLPEDSRLRTLTDLMEDGRITTDELRALGRGFGGGRGGHGHGGMFGPGPNVNGTSPDASASPTTSS